MTPSQSIVQEAAKSYTAIDAKGRRLSLRRLTALDTLRLFKAAGPVLAQNEPWLSMAGLAFSVLEIDGVPVPSPATEPQIESLIDRLGDEGLAAIADTFKDEHDTPDPKPHLGNSPGTPS
ncbi:MAG: hypothetical protein P4L90_19965 [Rhodopila sp.]|nr:hypothetical protein [Rhodopila sp.]